MHCKELLLSELTISLYCCIMTIQIPNTRWTVKASRVGSDVWNLWDICWWRFFTWYHTNLVVSTKQELGFFLFHCLCLSSSSRGAFDQATCVTSDAETWQTETLSIRFENLTWGTEKWKQCHRPHVWPHHSNWATVVAPNCLGVVLFHQLFSCEQEIPSCSLENPNWVCRHWRCAFLLECCAEWIVKCFS